MEAMTLEQSAYLAEIVGVFAIVVSLVYLSLQVRQNTRTTRLETVQTISSEFNNFNDMLASSGELADIYHRGVFDFQSLNTTEQVRFSLLLMRVFRTWYEQYFHWRKGALDAEFWAQPERSISRCLPVPGLAVGVVRTPTSIRERISRVHRQPRYGGERHKAVIRAATRKFGVMPAR